MLLATLILPYTFAPPPLVAVRRGPIAAVPRTTTVTALAPMHLLDTTSMQTLADAAASVPEWQAQLQQFQDSNAFLIGIVVAIATRAIINEVRYRIEKPVMDELGSRAQQSLTPDTERLDVGQWGLLGVCILLDLAGDASELIPFLGEFTDVGFAPAEAALIKLLFNSNALAAFGFAEEILPFTDVVPTFTISWALKNLWPTTPLARKLLPQDDPAPSK